MWGVEFLLTIISHPSVWVLPLDKARKMLYNGSNKLERRFLMNTVAVLTKDEYLYKKIAHSLDDCRVLRCELAADAECADTVLCDTDTVADYPTRAVTMSRRYECDLPIPFALDAPRRFLSGDEASLIPERRAVLLSGREVRLTELEYSLFSLIAASGGEPVSREEILERVWHSDADSGIVNVYIHYLREKLESDGERVILASRGKGYSLTAKYAALFAMARRAE